MSDDSSKTPAEHFYAEGMKYDLKQDKSPTAASFARANFQLGADTGDLSSVRALAQMVYEGRGGPLDKEQALLLLWSAFKRGDSDSLEELGDLLASYAEELENPSEAKIAATIAETIEKLSLDLSKISGYMYQIALSRSQQTSNP